MIFSRPDKRTDGADVPMPPRPARLPPIDQEPARPPPLQYLPPAYRAPTSNAARDLVAEYDALCNELTAARERIVQLEDAQRQSNAEIARQQLAIEGLKNDVAMAESIEHEALSETNTWRARFDDMRAMWNHWEAGMPPAPTRRGRKTKNDTEPAASSEPPAPSPEPAGPVIE